MLLRCRPLGLALKWSPQSIDDGHGQPY
jgi:hypothetical protein